MTHRLLFTFLLLGAATGCIAIAASGCSSSTTPPGSGTHTGGPDSGNGGQDTGTGGETSSGADSGGADGATGSDGGAEDGSHDAPAPDALYGCAEKGSFGWTCTATTTGPDPTECTDPNFPDCFVGGQGAWCTKTCASVSDCTDDAGGCTPSGCNTKGYCK